MFTRSILTIKMGHEDGYDIYSSYFCLSQQTKKE